MRGSTWTHSPTGLLVSKLPDLMGGKFSDQPHPGGALRLYAGNHRVQQLVAGHMITLDPFWACQGTAHMSAHSAVPDLGATSSTSLMRSARGSRSPLQPTTAHTSLADSARVCSLLLNTRTCSQHGQSPLRKPAHTYRHHVFDT